MSGYQELRDLGVTFRPFDGQPPQAGGRSSPFEASWSSTVDLLARELRHLEAKQIVVELGLEERDLRVDGLPRANARLALDGVRLSFESRVGALMYETGEFSRRWYGSSLDGWQANLRAIALGLEALRKVDRYGIANRGEQYRGWRALPTGTDPADAIATREQALALIASLVSDQYDHSDVEGPHLREAIREAQRRTHPDLGGDATEFRKVMRAVELVGA